MQLVLTGGKHGESLGTRILRLNRGMKLSKAVQKLSKNLWSEQSGLHNRSPPLNMPLDTSRYFIAAGE